MVLVPAGPFEMGSSQGRENEQPLHEVTLAAFYIDQYEVTNALYRRCVEAGACQKPGCLETYEAKTKKNHPVVCVNWDQAKTYCEWRGGRLPTEAEWEKAARGTDGRMYPWGDAPPDGTLLNFINSKLFDTRSVGSYPKGVSFYGVYDMAGNVWEWVADWYDENYYSNSLPGNPPGPPTADYKILRGGSWYSNDNNVRATYRNYLTPDGQTDDTGFRCATVMP
jgi:serine/threonine-protein kinase